jgi:pyruvate,water dikinase
VSTKLELLDAFYGSDEFPIDWDEGERELFWVYNDLYVPNPVSPMYFDIGGYWLNADYMFRRFGTSFGCDWLGKTVNGYLYTAAAPADPSARVESTQYEARYVARAPRDPHYAERMSQYLDWVLPHCADNFLTWWRERLRPEIERNFAYLDAVDYEAASLVELAVVLEDAIDIHDRHWKIHWQLNFAQLASTIRLETAIREVKGELDEELFGRLQSSVDDRNWDSIAALWKLKEEINRDEQLCAAFKRTTGADTLRALRASPRGQLFLAESFEPYRREFGNKTIWTHEFAFPTWRENPIPIVEAIRGYLESDYDYKSALGAVKADLDRATAELMQGVESGEGRRQLERALQLALKMNPLTPDHHFYIDQGTNARLRYVLVAIGRRLAAAGLLDDPEDVIYLLYNELRALMANPSALDARAIVSSRRDDHERALQLRPPDWIGTATKAALEFPYLRLWGYPERFHAASSTQPEEIGGLAASAGIAEGIARRVASPAEFDAVGDGEILVCRMTNPAWMVVFTKIAGLVTDAGGTISHPAVIAREFGIPAVVGTSVATERITTGDRIRVNGSTGRVEILSHD